MYICVYIYTCIYIYIFKYIYSYIFIYMYIYIDIYIYIYIQIYVYIHIYIYTHTHIHTRTHAHTHTHTHIQLDTVWETEATFAIDALHTYDAIPDITTGDTGDYHHAQHNNPQHMSHTDFTTYSKRHVESSSFLASPFLETSQQPQQSQHSQLSPRTAPGLIPSESRYTDPSQQPQQSQISGLSLSKSRHTEQQESNSSSALTRPAAASVAPSFISSPRAVTQKSAVPKLDLSATLILSTPGIIYYVFTVSSLVKLLYAMTIELAVEDQQSAMPCCSVLQCAAVCCSVLQCAEDPQSAMPRLDLLVAYICISKTSPYYIHMYVHFSECYHQHCVCMYVYSVAYREKSHTSICHL